MIHTNALAYRYYCYHCRLVRLRSMLRKVEFFLRSGHSGLGINTTRSVPEQYCLTAWPGSHCIRMIISITGCMRFLFEYHSKTLKRILESSKNVMVPDFGKYDSSSTKGGYIQMFREFTPKEQ